MKKPLILITGKDGQLGFELAQIQSKLEDKFDFLFVGRNEFDLTNASQVKDFLLTNQPKFIVNCAAFTAVDKAEIETDLAFEINAKAPALIAEICREFNCQLIHISTDYVFDGKKKKPHEPTDSTNPINTYGLSKLKGEKLILQNNSSAIIIRTSWVYSTHGKNFVKTILKLMCEKEEINVVDDQIGNPTYAADLAAAILLMIEKLNSNLNTKHQSIYHYSNTGNISWFQFAQSIQEMSKSNCKVNPVPTSSYPTPAKRSSYSVLNCEAITQDFDIEIKGWKVSLLDCLDKMKF